MFGESGSGKTVLLSSFYGALQEPSFKATSRYKVISDDGQGLRLHQNYLGMRDSALVPQLNRFISTSYEFKVVLQDLDIRANNREARKLAEKAKQSRSFDALRFTWHDYPGEWFDSAAKTELESQRRLDTFRALLGADVGIILVDGQRLLDNQGEEERYLKALFNGFSNTLEVLKGELLSDGKPLVEFPRVWIIALSKADLLEEMDVHTFKELVVRKSAGEILELEEVIQGLVADPEALSVGHDFLILSSAKFENDRIETSKRIGLDLILPIAETLPLENYIDWFRNKKLRKEAGEHLLDGFVEVAKLLWTDNVPLPRLARAALGIIKPRNIVDLADMGKAKLDEIYEDALTKHDGWKTVIAKFALDLQHGKDEGVLVRE